MNLWALDDESVTSRARVKKAAFSGQVEVASSSGWGADEPSQRRKQRGKVEFLVEDNHASDDDCDNTRKAVDADAGRSSGARKADEVISADVVEPPQQNPERRQSKVAARDDRPQSALDNNVHHLVREFLLTHNHEDIVKLLDQERPIPLLTTKEAKQFCRRTLGSDEGPRSPVAPSMLECVLIHSNEAKLGQRTKQPASTERKSRTKSSSTSRRKKPALNVITTDLSQDDETTRNTPVKSPQDSQFNRLNHPGHTPRPQPHETIIGEPGSTPHAGVKDLRALGFEDMNDSNSTPSITLNASQEGSAEVCNDADQLSEYAIRKRASMTGRKQVKLGNPGSTPTKEYIFFRETPPSFVTETIEEAVEVYEKLGNDPNFVQQAAATERFIELQSSEVSKYAVGQQVNGLGTYRDISGVVTKLYGSRLCGSAGPGTIVIDTRPNDPPVSDN